MPSFTVQEIIRATRGALVSGDLGVLVTGVSIDTRTLGVGEAFFAIRGHRLDGHDFLADAAARGAGCLVVHALPDDIPAGVPLVMVEDTTVALGRLASMHRNRLAIPIVAVTGSNGKTTTKEMVAGVLSVRWRTHRPRSSFNNQWGLPLTLFAIGPDHQAAVVEIGANQPGEIAYLAGIARPTVAVVTTVAAVHTEFFGSLDGVRDEKAALVRALGAEGHAVLNADDARVASMARDTAATVITYGRSAGARVRASAEHDDPGRGVGFTLEVDGRRQPVTLAFSGRHNVANALAAAAVGVALGFSPDEIARGLAEARPVAGRCVWKSAGRVRILDDTYNANPVSVAAALDTLAAHRGTSRTIVVLGDMLELGDITDEAHREAGRRVAALAPAHFIAVGRHAALAAEAARAAGVSVHHATTFEDTMAELLKRVVPGDVVLVKGSRGMRMERVVDALVARLKRPDAEHGQE
jgi:UDP-N-acetylmuramoyl-tripeptide--D-alanyl-D-alanine ligase